jgi:hypothetical protein
MEHLSKTKHKTGDTNEVYCALCHFKFESETSVYGHIQKRHPEVTKVRKSENSSAHSAVAYSQVRKSQAKLGPQNPQVSQLLKYQGPQI